MANFVTPALLFGVILLVASVGLFLFGRIKPELQRDSDNVYAIVGMVCALILLANFNLGLGMSFQQLLMIGALLTLMWENIQNRQPRASNPRRGSFDDMRDGMRQWGDTRRGRPGLDNERAASNIYRYEAEYNDYDRFDAPRRQEQRRIRGSEPRRGYDDEFGGDARGSRPSGRGPQASLKESDDRRGYDGFDDRAPARGPSNRPPRNDDWDDAPRRGRNGARDAGPADARAPRGRGSQDFDARPQNDMPPPRRRPRSGSMDGSPIPPGFQEQPSGRPGPDGPNPNGGGRPPMGRPSGPPSDRPPLNAPPSGRPPADRPSMDRPPMDRPPMDRPPLTPPPTDRPPSGRPPTDRPPINAGPAPQRSNGPKDDDYVDFKPLTPPPEDEMDNSSQFDD